MANSENKKTHLSFTIGPVQGFVAQARRTRDLWCGSWMLSYLSECAIAAAENVGGVAIMPYRSETNRGKITSKESSVGGIPNRFELGFKSQDQAKQAAEAATTAFEEAWEKIAEEVWKQFVKPATGSVNQTKAIWDRQIKNFWEVNWVIGTPDDGQKTIGHLAAARKNFRNVAAGPESGTKCSLMAEYQELSGHTGRSGQVKFWSEVQEKIGGLDLAESERLCAIALVKRLFPKVSKQVIGNDLKNQNWPSTAFVAALPWLQKLDGKARESAKEYCKTLKDANIDYSETQAARQAGIAWASVDGPCWFENSFGKTNDWNLDKSTCPKLVEKLKTVFEVADSKPLPYYALLLMDGDLMGKLLQKLDASKLSECLDTFTKDVDGVVTDANGRTVYAGGDDVMAILPAVSALGVAAKLASHYEAAFENTNAEGIATLSGAIVYAHYKYPLRQILQHAHQLLDGIAKEATGRDALAIGIVQGSGLNSVWSAPWKSIRYGSGSASDKSTADTLWLESIVSRFGSNEKDESGLPLFNASFLYHLREQFSRLFELPLEEVGQFGKLNLGDAKQNGLGDVLSALANAEYRRQLGSKAKEITPEETQEKLAPLMLLSQRMTRDPKSLTTSADNQTFGFDGWRVARFLKQLQEGKVAGNE